MHNQSIRRFPVLFALAVFVMAIFAAPASADALPGWLGSGGPSSPGQLRAEEELKAPDLQSPYIVVFENSVKGPAAVAKTQVEQRDGELGFVYRHALKGYSAELSKADVEALRKDPRIKYVAPDRKVKIFSQSVPTGVNRALATTNPGTDIDEADDARVDVDVAVIDTGIDPEHPDLDVYERTDCVPAVWGEKTVCVDDSGQDDNGHGTHVAGTIGAIDNGEGVVGIAPGARLWGVKALNESGVAFSSWIIAGVDWVTAHASEIEVANMSLGAHGTNAPLDTAINKSVEAGVVYVVAAGNSAANAATYSPASNPNVITVSALADYDGASGAEGAPTCGNGGEDDRLASFSNYGSVVEVAAPGVCIESTVPLGGSTIFGPEGPEYGSISGTSMASPHVAGAAALLAAKSNPATKKDTEAIRQQLVEEGNTEWTDTSGDEKQEPLLDLGTIAAKQPTLESESKGTLRGKVKPGGLETTYRFEYGKTTAYGTSVPVPDKAIGSGTKYVDVSQAISGLQGKTTYHYRVSATNSKGTFRSADRVFATTGPSATTDAATEVNPNHATLNATINPNGANATYRFEYGKTDSYGDSLTLESLSAGTEAVKVSQVLGVLNAETTYHYRVTATSFAGTSQGKDQTFTTGSAQWRPQQAPDSPKEAGEFEISSGFEAVDCTSASECMAVGGAAWWEEPLETIDGEHEAPIAHHWDEGKWSEVSLPRGFEEEYPSAVSCPSEEMCVLVGGASQKGFRGVVGYSRPIVDVWDGTSWARDESAMSLYKEYDPAHRLSDVDCASTTHCVAVGFRYVPVKEGEGLGGGSLAARPWSIVWDGEEWSELEAPHPSPTMSASLWSVSCTSAESCIAVGRYHSGKNDWPALVTEYDGKEWSLAAGTGEGSGHSGGLSDISCTGADLASIECMAIDINWDEVRRYDGEEWSAPEFVPIPPGGAGGFWAEVSCTSPTSCTLAGGYGAGTHGAGVTQSWNGSEWSAGSTSEPTAEEFGSALIGVTCLPARCVAVGAFVSTEKFETRPLVLTREPARSDPATEVTFNSATLNGVVDPNGLETTYRFEYGTTTAYGAKVPVPDKSIGSGTAEIKVSEAIKDLKLGTTYHYRVVATNAEGTAYGEDRTFTTEATDPRFAFAFGETGSGSGQLSVPSGIAVEASGNVWVADSENHRIQKFNAKGEYLSQLTNAFLSYPTGIAIDASGNLWITDAGSNRVLKYSSEGKYLAQFGSEGSSNGQLYGPMDLAIDASGNLWVVDAGNHRVQKFNSEGKYLAQFGTKGTGNGQFIDPASIAIDASGNAWVADSFNSRVQKFNSSGTYQSQFGTQGTGNGQLKFPYGIEVDSAGNVWVADTDNARVQKFNSEGKYLAQFGTPGQGEGQFEAPTALDADSSGHVWVADLGKDEVQKWTLTPTATSEAASEVSEASATLNGTVDPNALASTYQFEYGTTTAYGTKVPASPKSVGSGIEDVKVTEPIKGLKPSTTYHYRVIATNAEGTAYGKDATFTTKADSRFAFAFGKVGTGNGQFAEIYGLTIDSSGNIWVADTGNNRLQKFNAKGGYLSQFGGPLQFNGPTGIAIDGSGNIWVADAGNNRVVKHNSEGKYLAKFGTEGSGNGQFNVPLDLAIDGSGNIWVTDSGNHRVQKFNSEGKYLAQFGTKGSGNGQFLELFGIDIDGSGNIWVTDSGNHRVQKFNSSGTYQSQFGTQGTGNGQLKYPFGIEVDSGGNVWVTDTDNARVQKFNSEGKYLAQFGAKGEGLGQFLTPTTLAAGSAGDIWVADTGKLEVQKWVP